MQKHPDISQINDNPALNAAIAVIRRISESGQEVYLVGGGVRDLLLGRPVADFDVATSAHPGLLQELFPQAHMVGAKFGVMLVRYGKHSIEVATFREEGEYSDKRRPDLVRFSTREKDVTRRDFTVNALYYDPIRNLTIDTVGGLRDLKDGVIRTVNLPEDRFNEDALRILRCLRFAANLEFDVEERTWEALVRLAGNLESISVERIRDELVKGFIGGHPHRFLELLDQSGILSQLLPEMNALKTCQQPPEFHPEGDVFTHVGIMLKELKTSPSPELVFAVLLHDIAKPVTQTNEDRIRFNGHDRVGAVMAQEICNRLRFSGRQIDAISGMVKRHMQFINVPKMRRSTLMRFLDSPTIEDELELHRVDCLASHGNLETYDYARAALAEMRRVSNDRRILPKAYLNGRDLISNGLAPGPDFSRILQDTYDAQLDGKVTSYDGALEFALNQVRNCKKKVSE